jgi:hypothetical protein
MNLDDYTSDKVGIAQITRTRAGEAEQKNAKCGSGKPKWMAEEKSSVAQFGESLLGLASFGCKRKAI